MTPATSPGIRLDRTGPVATISLCRPEVLNAQTPQMWGELREIGRGLPGDVRVVVIRGEGRAFSAGIDLSVAQSSFGTMAGLPPEEAQAVIAGYQEGFSWLRRP